MLNWLRRKPAVVEEPWIRAQQPPGVPFPFPKGAKLKPEEDVVLALPRALIPDDEKIGSVLLCDDSAEFTLNEKVGAFYVRLKAGMVFALAKSCEVMLIAEDKRPRSFQIMKPVKRSTEPGASPNGGPAERSDNSGVSGGPPSVS